MSCLYEHRLVHVIWCDDIRQEVGNKPSFMGVYNYLGVPSVPFVIPRLAAFITLHTPINRPFSNVTVRVMKSDVDGPLAELSIVAPKEAHEVPEGISFDDGEPKVGVLSFALLIGAITIDSSSKWLKVSADVDGEQIDSLKLRIVRPQLPSPAAAN